MIVPSAGEQREARHWQAETQRLRESRDAWQALAAARGALLDAAGGAGQVIPWCDAYLAHDAALARLVALGELPGPEGPCGR